jgi:hypothetical protein
MYIDFPETSQNVNNNLAKSSMPIIIIALKDYGVRYAARTDRNGHKHSVSARLDAVFTEL